jgi:Uma2 family endonuclease
MATVLAAPMTLEEFARLPKDGVRHEVNAGELLTLPTPKSLHSRIVNAVLDALAVTRTLPGVGYILSRDPLIIRQPDISVLNPARIRATDPDSYFEGAPELADEVVSPSDSAEDLDIKRSSTFRPGPGRSGYSIQKRRLSRSFRAAPLPSFLSGIKRSKQRLASGI